MRYNQIEIKWGVKEMANILVKSHLCRACRTFISTRKTIRAAHFGRWFVSTVAKSKKKQTKTKIANNLQNHILRVFCWCSDNIQYKNFIAPEGIPNAAKLTSINKINIYTHPYIFIIRLTMFVAKMLCLRAEKCESVQ